MNPEVVLVFNGGYLKPLKLEHIHDDYISGLNDNRVNRYLELRHVIQTKQTVIRYIQDNQQAKNNVLFGIWRDSEQNHCGTVRLHGIKDIEHSAHIGLCIFEKRVWGNGLGSKVIACVTKWAIDDLRLRWIEAGIYEENVASQKAFLKAGFKWISDNRREFNFDGNTIVVKIYAYHKV